MTDQYQFNILYLNFYIIKYSEKIIYFNKILKIMECIEVFY